MRLFFGVFLFLTLVCQGQEINQIKSFGLPFITNYGQSEYDFSSHNYDVLIGDDHKIYFANFQGILVFDGVNWTKLSLPNETSVSSLTKSNNGTIYVGGMNEIGYLGSDESGRLKYVSLTAKLTDQGLGTFTSLMHTIDNKIVATINSKIALIDPNTNEITLLDNPSEDCSIQSVSDSLYAFCGNQLYQLKSEKWEFLRESRHRENTQFTRGHLVEITHDQTLVISRKGFSDFETETKLNINKDVEQMLSQSTVIRVSKLSDKYLAICTWSGLLITDFAGEPILFIDQKRGLTDNHLFRVALDKHGILWVATYNGISKIDLFSAFSILDKRMGVEGVIKDAQLHKGRLYYSAVTGIFSEDWKSFQNPFHNPEFRRDNDAVCHQMINTSEDLFVYTERQNNLVLKNDRFQDIRGTQEKIYWAGFKYKNSEDLLLASHDGFLAHIIKDNNQWVIRNKLDPQFLGVYFLIEGQDDNIWLSNVGEGIYRMKYNVQNAELLEDRKYGVSDGLPDLNCHVYLINSKPCFITSKGIYRYDQKTDSFRPDERFINVVGEEPISIIDEDEQGNLYYYSDEFVMLKKTSEGFKKIRFPHMNFKQYPPSDITVIDHQNIIISTLNALIHVNPMMKPAKKEFKLNITKLSSLKGDSSIFNGFGSTPNDLLFLPNNNAFRFTFSAAFHQNPELTQYKWRLNGFDTSWSEWTNETQKDYTNLSHGNFSFEAVARNVHGGESPPASIQFTIVTPWYFTIWAYVVYAIFAGMGVWAIVLLNTRWLRLQNFKLEEKIVDRTEEIRQQRNKLKQMDDLKKRFFVNISHELRTPLTLSMGTVNQALEGKYGELNNELYRNLKVSKRNNERLLKMVNSILDISKLEGGRIQLYARAQDPITTIKKVLAFFSSRFEDKNIELQADLIEGTELYLDDDRYETILINLLSNAFKFTPEGGRIEVSMTDFEDHLEIKVCDSGDGIPDKDLELVFDRFYQSPTIKSGEGMGVGLALTKELVELHSGSVQAKNNDGAEFVISFLKGADHLSPNEIVEEEKATSSLEDKYPLHDDTKEAIYIETNHEATEHVLLVEDNPEMAQFISGILQNKYRVSHVKNGLEGLQFLKEESRPDLIITDYLMPEMDGYEMAQEIKKDPNLATVPIIFLTARAREQDKINVLNLGVDDYLFKPFNPEELLVRIKNLLYTQKQRTDFVQEEAINSEDIEWKDFESKLKQKVDEFISDNIKNEMTGDQLAAFTNQSERTLYRKIKANTGLSVMGYVKEYRLRKARTMLENQEMPTVSEISYAVGFNYLSHFTKSYKERFGKQPSEYLE